MSRWSLAMVSAVLGSACFAASAGATTLVLPRAGQVGIGLQGQFGSLASTGELGQEFGSGGGLAVRLRYRMRYERAAGLSFESFTLDARHPDGRAGAFDSLTDSPAVTRQSLKATLAGLELYQLFDTRSKAVKMLSAGFGLAQFSAKLSDGETQYPIAGDGVYLSAGAGLERFVYRSWALDLSTRYHAIFHDGNVNHDVQVSAGMIFYAAY